jgi:amino acid transporter
MGTHNDGEQLARVLGVRQLSANIVNYVVGSGIFVLPATVAATLGPAALTAYGAAAACVALVALCFAECGSRVTRSGGTYAYVETAFGSLAGALAGAFAYLSYIAAGGAVANAFVHAVAVLFPVLGTPVPRVLIILALFLGLGAANVRGAAVGARIVEFTTAGKMIPLVLLVAVGAFFVQPVHFAGFHWPAIGPLASSTLMLVFAFTGTEGALTPSGEVKDPARTVPRAIAVGILVVTALYAGIQVVAQGVLGPDLATEQAAPLAAVARRIAGSPGATLILAAAAISMFGYLASNMLSSPRVLYGLASDRMLPRPLAAVHPRFQTPHVAILVHAVLSCALAVIGSFGPLVLISTVATMMLYAGCAAAALVLRRRDVRAGGPPFVSPGGPLVPLLSIAVTAWLVASASVQEWAAVGGAAVLIVVAWLLRRARAGGTAA